MNQKTIQQLLILAEKRLVGDWVLLGGTLLYYFGIEKRVTTDIDLVPISKKDNSGVLSSMELAQDLNLPVETINSAVLFFLEKIPNYREDLIELRKWKNGCLYRPNLYLFLKLKLNRLSESDFQDCSDLLDVHLPEKTPEQMIRIRELVLTYRSKKNKMQIDSLLKKLK